MTECASSFLSQLRQEGFSLRVDGERLMVSPSSRLTDSQKEGIGLHKPALLALLADEEEWERQTALLATAEPVWAGSPVQMVTVAILRWYDAAGNVIHEAALPAEEDTRLLEGFRQLRTLREIGRAGTAPKKAKKKRDRDQTDLFVAKEGT